MTEPSDCPMLDKLLAARPVRRAAERMYGRDAAEAIDRCAEISRQFAATRAAFGLPEPPTAPEPMLPRPPFCDPAPFDREAFVRFMNDPMPRVRLGGRP